MDPEIKRQVNGVPVGVVSPVFMPTTKEPESLFESIKGISKLVPADGYEEVFIKIGLFIQNSTVTPSFKSNFKLDCRFWSGAYIFAFSNWVCRGLFKYSAGAWLGPPSTFTYSGLEDSAMYPEAIGREAATVPHPLGEKIAWPVLRGYFWSNI